jgi:acyl-CoA thioester hydrolase
MRAMTADCGQHLGGFFRGSEHILPVRVYYEDTDFSGVVYHGAYVRFMERGRSDFLRLIGISHRDLLALDEPIAFTIQRLEIDFYKPARIDDALEVRTAYTRATGARIEARQDIWRGGEQLTTGRVHAACINLEGRARRLPPSVRAALASRITDAHG